MNKSDNHIDELGEILDTLVHNAILYGRGQEKDITDIQIDSKRQIEDFYRNKIPSKQSVPKGDLTSVGLQVRFRALGYNQAIDDITAQFNRGDSDE